MGMASGMRAAIVDSTVDSDTERRWEALYGALSRRLDVLIVGVGGEPRRIDKASTTWQYEPVVQTDLLVCFRHLGDPRRGSQITATVTVYYSGGGADDAAFWGAGGVDETSYPRRPDNWRDDGPEGYLVQRAVPRNGADPITDDAIDEIVDWAVALRNGEHPALPALLKPRVAHFRDDYLAAVCILCQGYLVVHAQSSAPSTEVTEALTLMAYPQLSRSQALDSLRARLEAASSEVHRARWWLAALGDEVPAFNAEVGDPFIERVWPLLQILAAAGTSKDLDLAIEPNVVANAFLGLWEYWESGERM